MAKVVTLNGGQVITAHEADKCSGQACPIHNPSGHRMRTWPQFWRRDRGIMERICPHGVGHPDPDCIYAQAEWGIHGCDGCCSEKADGHK